MKSLLKVGALATITLLTAFGATGCKDKNKPVNPDQITVTLDASAKTIEVGKSETLKATLKGKNLKGVTILWQSSDPKVATVDKSGTVKGVKPGTAKVTATASRGKASASCAITVKETKK